MIEQGQFDSFSFSASHPALVFACTHALFLPVSLSSLLPYPLSPCLTLFFAGLHSSDFIFFNINEKKLFLDVRKNSDYFKMLHQN